MENFLNVNHPAHCIITEPCECGKSFFLTNLFLHTVYEFEILKIHSPTIHQNLYQKLIKYFSKFLPMNNIPNILNDEGLDVVIDEVVRDKDFNKSYTETDTYR